MDRRDAARRHWPVSVALLVSAMPMAVVGGLAVASVSVREARTELVLEPVDLDQNADEAHCLERGTKVDDMFAFPWFPLLSNQLELSCNVLRRCSGEVALDYEPSSDRDLTVEQLADRTFVVRWIEDVGARTDGISRGRIPRCADARRRAQLAPLPGAADAAATGASRPHCC